MRAAVLPCVLLALVAAALPATGQRITTIQLDGVQYFVSRMNPYSPELNYFLAYQYCRSLGLQLASFETKEKADSITTYLQNAGYMKYDFWTSGNNLGTDMFLWMSTGLPFNATFNYMRRAGDLSEVVGTEPAQHVPQALSMDPLDVPQGSTAPQRTARHGSTDHVLSDGCVVLKGPNFHWESQHCGDIKDFICEQTRCYYYNYGSIPVSSKQGKPLSLTTTTTASPLTSSSPSPPRSEHLPTHFTLNDLLGKLRPSSLDGLQSPHLKAASALAHKNLPQVDGHYSGIKHHDRVQESQGQSEKETAAPSTYDGDTDINDAPTQLPNEPDNSVDEEGAATMGPYNHNADMQMGDDPNAYAAASNNNSGDDYVSTIEPDVVTTYKSETMQRIAGKVLAAPSY